MEIENLASEVSALEKVNRPDLSRVLPRAGLARLEVRTPRRELPQQLRHFPAHRRRRIVRRGALHALVLELFRQFLDLGVGGLALDAQNGLQKPCVLGLRRQFRL